MLDSAIERYRFAVEIAIGTKDEAPHLNSLGYVYFLKEDCLRSGLEYRRALEIFDKNAVKDSIQYYII
ncbi:MAG: hypothetical protein ACI837_000926 [Crocinitomicaceae bacterium]|jgi:hypothetical protein